MNNFKPSTYKCLKVFINAMPLQIELSDAINKIIATSKDDTKVYPCLKVLKYIIKHKNIRPADNSMDVD